MAQNCGLFGEHGRTRRLCRHVGTFKRASSDGGRSKISIFDDLGGVFGVISEHVSEFSESLETILNDFVKIFFKLEIISVRLRY